MRRLGLLLMLAAASADTASAQAADTVFVGSRHSPVVSGIIEFLVPTAGFAYAGDWTRGFLPNAFRIASVIGFSVTADGPEDDVCEEDTACNLWGVGMLGTTVWAIVGAVQTANDHNRSITSPQQARFLIEPSPFGGVSVGLRLRR